METPIRFLATPAQLLRVYQRRKGLPGSVKTGTGSEKMRDRGSCNRNGAIHIETVCQKESFDDRLENVYEGKTDLSYWGNRELCQLVFSYDMYKFAL